jgi:hypothetical protein
MLQNYKKFVEQTRAYKRWVYAGCLVAHTCNPSYSGGRDQEACDWKPVQENGLQNPISKTPFTNRTGGAAQGVGPEFKPQYQKINK